MTIIPHPKKPASPPSCVLRDLAAALMQQMFFWGMDAANSSGNLFEKRGFNKTPSPGLKGTSCYSLPWQGGEIFLHGACVGWFPDEVDQRGFVFIRPAGKCFLWEGIVPPVPGEWPVELLSPISLEDDISSYFPFILWLLDHEEWVSAEMGGAYRMECHRKYKSLPKSKPWLPPGLVVSWLTLFLESPATTPRGKAFSRSQAR